MGRKVESCSTGFLTTTASALSDLAAILTQIALDMELHKTPPLMLPWNARQTAALDVLVEVGPAMAAKAKTEILAAVQKRESPADKLLARRAKRQASEKETAKRPVGRPRKGTNAS